MRTAALSFTRTPPAACTSSLRPATDLDGYTGTATGIMRVRNPADHKRPRGRLRRLARRPARHRGHRSQGKRRGYEPGAVDARDRALRKRSLRDNWRRGSARSAARSRRSIPRGSRSASTSCDCRRPTSPAEVLRRRPKSSSRRPSATAATSDPPPTSRPLSEARSSTSRAATTRSVPSTPAASAQGGSLVWRDLRVDSDVALTAAGTYKNPLREGSHVFVDTPTGGRAGFTFVPQQISGPRLQLLPAEVGLRRRRDLAARVGPRCRSSARRASSTRSTTASAYNPASLAGVRAQYSLIDAAGTRWALNVADGLTSIMYADGVSLLISDSGVVWPGERRHRLHERRPGSPRARDNTADGRLLRPTRTTRTAISSRRATSRPEHPSGTPTLSPRSTVSRS